MCRDCKARMHTTCWKEFGGCAVCQTSRRSRLAKRAGAQSSSRSYGVVIGVLLLVAVGIGVLLDQSPRDSYSDPHREAWRADTQVAPTTNRAGFDLSHVRVGMKLYFTTWVDTPDMTTKSSSTWTVTRIRRNVAIHYDVHTTSMSTMKNPPPGMAPMKPQISEVTDQRFPLTDLRSNLPKTPSRGIETLEVSGVTFQCEVYEQNEGKIWIDPKRFPAAIKRTGNATVTLMGITY